MPTSDDRSLADLDSKLDNFSGRLPIFPLPNLVTFPGMLQPLHIFEPRYRAMVAAAMGGERLIGMGLLAPGWELDYEGLPPVHPVVCAGMMLETVQLPDGRYNMVLVGLRRARIEQWVQDEPFRVAQVTLLRDVEIDSAAAARGAARLKTIVAAMKRAGMIQGWDESLERLGPLTDALAAAVQVSPEHKQTLLAELDLGQRAALLAEILAHAYEQARLLDNARRFRPETPNLN